MLPRQDQGHLGNVFPESTRDRIPTMNTVGAAALSEHAEPCKY